MTNKAKGEAKSLYGLHQSLREKLFEETKPGYFTDGPKLTAQCKRLANQVLVIGNTVFKFNKDGITEVINHTNTKIDFDYLLKKNGVIEIKQEESKPQPKIDIIEEYGWGKLPTKKEIEEAIRIRKEKGFI